MMNLWGSDEHGPGGDPSWLGGKDRGGPGTGTDGAGSAAGKSGPLPSGDSTWSSDFGPSSARQSADQDFGSGSSDSQYSGPRFGEFADDDRRREASQSGSGSDADRAREVGKALLKMVPTVIFLVIFIGFFSRSGFGGGGFGFWWFALMFLVPQLTNLVKILRK
ncbi:hypothetical protein [Brachybacterium paraconglomeratum]|uniref:hypothetical protein n=1 Tax=Brachybacterium paraconglomeratum TaxID=173362 RepID=UPI00223ACA1D|nr:hypothetical protein [Brachybacterium paraconglomeratum]MCT1438769.1 hypothetical protein [Brachybacterium paraconglomeratum]